MGARPLTVSIRTLATTAVRSLEGRRCHAIVLLATACSPGKRPSGAALAPSPGPDAQPTPASGSTTPIIGRTDGPGWNGPDRLESRLVHSLKQVRPSVGVHSAGPWRRNGVHWMSGPTDGPSCPSHFTTGDKDNVGSTRAPPWHGGWSEATGMELVDALVRPKSGRSLTRLTRQQRIHRTRELYAGHPSLHWPDRVEGVLLLDDVITTGSTWIPHVRRSGRRGRGRSGS